MKCKKNLLSMLLALVMILGIFVGCGATPASGGASSAAAPDLLHLQLRPPMMLRLPLRTSRLPLAYPLQRPPTTPTS